MSNREQPGQEDPSEASDVESQEAELTHVEELTKIFNESWAESHEEGDPEVSFKFFFGAHGRAQDVHPNLREELEAADIYMPEEFDWPAEAMTYLNGISSGAIPLDESDTYDSALEQALHDTDTVILLPDLPEGHPTNERIEASMRVMNTAVNLPYDAAVKMLDRGVRDFVAAGHDREKEIMGNIPKLIRKTLLNNEDLRDKKNLNVLLSYGSGHTPMYHALSRTDHDAKREMRTRPDYVYGYANELQRSISFGIAEEDRNTELTARALIETPVYEELDLELMGIDATSNEILHATRLAVEMLKEEDFRDVWNAYIREGDPSVILSEIKKRGFTMPANREELDELLQSRRKP